MGDRPTLVRGNKQVYHIWAVDKTKKQKNTKQRNAEDTSLPSDWSFGFLQPRCGSLRGEYKWKNWAVRIFRSRSGGILISTKLSCCLKCSDPIAMNAWD